MPKIDAATSWSLGLWSLSTGPLLPWSVWYADATLPAWVQAIGSIAAILGAFGVVSWQQSLAARSASQTLRSARHHALVEAIVGSQTACDVARHVQKQLNDNPDTQLWASAAVLQELLETSVLDLTELCIAPTESLPARILTKEVRTHIRALRRGLIVITQLDPISQSVLLTAQRGMLMDRANLILRVQEALVTAMERNNPDLVESVW